LPNIAPLSGYIVPGVPDGLLREGAGVDINLNPGQSLRVNDFKFLRPHRSVAGRVVTPGGEPVAGVEVHIGRSNVATPMNDGPFWANDIAPVLPTALKHPPNSIYRGMSGKICAAISDVDGKFSIHNLPPERVILYVMRFSDIGPEIPVQNVMVEVGKQAVKLICPPREPSFGFSGPSTYKDPSRSNGPFEIEPRFLPTAAR